MIYTHRKKLLEIFDDDEENNDWWLEEFIDVEPIEIDEELWWRWKRELHEFTETQLRILYYLFEGDLEECKKWVKLFGIYKDLAESVYNVALWVQELNYNYSLAREWAKITPHFIDYESLKRLKLNNLKLVKQWLRYFDSPKETLQWMKLFKTPHEALEWKKAGFEPSEASAWAQEFYTPEEAREWVLLGFNTPDRAIEWEDEGFTPAEAYEWEKAGYTPTRAKKLKRAGYSPKDIIK